MTALWWLGILVAWLALLTGGAAVIEGIVGWIKRRDQS